MHVHNDPGEGQARGSVAPALTLTATLLFLWASYVAASRLPNSTGWENGPVENLQVAMLLAGGLVALHGGHVHQPGRLRTFWRLMAPIWFVLAVRELSWGACFLPPYDVAIETGPKFSSSVQLWYRPAVPYLLLALLGLLLFQFVRTGQIYFLAALWKRRQVPWVELSCAVLCMLASGAAEGHLYVDLAFEHHWMAQNFEELSETGAYALVLMAQWRVFRDSILQSRDASGGLGR